MELLAFGTLWFWILMSATIIAVIICLETEDWGGTGATWTFIVTAGLLYFFGGDEISSIFSYLNENPGRSFGFVAGYFGIGLVWSFVKWYLYLLKIKERYTEVRDTNSRLIDPIYKFSEDDIPLASKNKGTIISWMTYWPMSSFWTLLNDPVQRLFRFIYGRFENLYQKMSNSMFSELKSKSENQSTGNDDYVTNN